jgi:hypothetical protein
VAGREGYGETDHTTDGTRKLFVRGGEKRWKGIFSLDPTDTHVRAEEWYDLGADPGERHRTTPPPAVADPARRLALQRWKSARGSGEGAPAVLLSPEQRERLRSLGYVSP